MSHEWFPSTFFHGQPPAPPPAATQARPPPPSPYALIILNQPVNQVALRAVARHAALIVCADGGANRFFESGVGGRGQGCYVPDAVIGDLDSIRADVEQYYRSRLVRVVRDADQNATDFTKCLRWLRRDWIGRMGGAAAAAADAAVLDIVALGGLGGRLDQGFSQMHHLYMAARDPELLNGRLYLLSEQSLSFVLENGRNVIHLQPGIFDKHVGILPAAGPASITTKGLEWDVQDWTTEVGGQISTSNHVVSDTVEIESEGNRVLFTIELASRLCTSP